MFKWIVLALIVLAISILYNSHIKATAQYKKISNGDTVTKEVNMEHKP
jgi:hypothetical protein